MKPAGLGMRCGGSRQPLPERVDFAQGKGESDVKAYDTAQIRNVTILGHGASGKTLLAESLLFMAGATTRRGNPADGTSVLDSSPEEVKRRMTLSMGFAPIEYNGFKVNFIDTAGSPDFVGESEAALYATDLAMILVNGTAGVEPDTDRFFDLAQASGKPLCFVINQMDKEQANFATAVESIQREISDRAVPFFLPIGSGKDFSGLIEVVAGKAYHAGEKGHTRAGEIPADAQGPVDEIRAKLTEAAAEADDTLLEKYLEDGTLSPEQIQKGLREGFHKGILFPILVTSAETMLGLDRLLEFIAAWGPSPLEAAAPLALREGLAEPARLAGRIDGSPVAFVFKTFFDDRLGEYTILRGYAGKLSPGDYYNARKQTTVRIGALYALRGRERLDLEALVCGDIAATPRIKGTTTNDTLSSKDQRVVVTPIPFSEPMHTVAVSGVAKGDEEKITGGYTRLQDFDPTFHVRVDSALRQTLVSGMGDQHIDVMTERMKARAKVEVNIKKPRIPYRETIQSTVEDIQGRYKKQTGGRGQYGDVHLKIEPLPRGGGFEFVDAIVGGVVPSKFIPAVEKGVRETMERGVLVGYPVVDVRTTLHYGSYHDVDSSEQAFKMAAWMAFKEGFLKCHPVLLEPIMQLEIVVPDSATGDIMGDLSSRRGRILGMERRGKRQSVKAVAPLGELYGYLANLRSMTQGRGQYRMELSHYEEVPRETMDRLVPALQQEMEEAKS
ncbi:MAG: elongation factor G [Candidatus Eisenbacteria bacterium]